MPGKFSKTNRPDRAGTYVNWEIVSETVLPISTGAVVAVPFTHDWGPMETVVRLGAQGDFLSVYGPSQDTQGYRAVYQAFQGEGTGGSSGGGPGGASQVLAFRMVGASGATASRSLSNTTPVASLVLTAKYGGAYANQLRVTVQDYLADATKSELILYLGTVEVERYRYPDADINALRDEINATSGWVTATAPVSGVALAVVTAQAFTGGDSGTTILAADYTAAMAALDVERFGVFAPADLTDTTIVASMKSWAQNLNAKGKRFMTVLGGASDELYSVALARAVALNDPDFVTLGMGHVVDEDFGSLSTAQLAPRIAGILAQRGEAQSLTFARIGGSTLVSGATENQIDAAFGDGIMVLGRDQNEAAPVRIEKGLTTYTVKTDDDRPYAIYRVPKFVRTMHALEQEFQEWFDRVIVGRYPVNNGTRNFAIAEVQSRLARREATGVLQPGSSVAIDQDPPPSDDDEFIALVIGLGFGRSVEQVFLTMHAR